MDIQNISLFKFQWWFLKTFYDSYCTRITNNTENWNSANWVWRNQVSHTHTVMQTLSHMALADFCSMCATAICQQKEGKCLQQQAVCAAMHHAAPPSTTARTPFRGINVHVHGLTKPSCGTRAEFVTSSASSPASPESRRAAAPASGQDEATETQKKGRLFCSVQSEDDRTAQRRRCTGWWREGFSCVKAESHSTAVLSDGQNLFCHLINLYAASIVVGWGLELGGSFLHYSQGWQMICIQTERHSSKQALSTLLGCLRGF